MFYLRLFRFRNLLIIALTQYLLRFCIIKPLLLDAGCMPSGEFDFLLLVLSSMLIAAAGYTINDYFDLKIDRVNRPQKMVLGSKIPIKKAIIIHWIFNSLGVLIGLYLGYHTGSILIASINLLTSVLLWFYSVKYKKMPLTGNVVVSLLSALIVLYPWLFELQLLKLHPDVLVVAQDSIFVINTFVYGFAFFAFWVSLIRELVKDMEDCRGDATAGCKTLPLVWGIRNTKKLVMVLTWIMVLLTAMVQFTFLHNNYTAAFWYFSFVVQVFMLVFLYFAAKSGNKSHFHFLSILAKIIMLLGIMGMLFIWVNLS